LLAKEIGVTSKAILEKCRAEGLDVKNHMTVLSAGLEATIREWFSEGAHSTTEEKTERVNLDKIRSRRKKEAVSEEQPAATEEEAEAEDESVIAEEIEAEEAEEQKVEAIPEVTSKEPSQPLAESAAAAAEAEEITEVKPEAVKAIEVEEELTEVAKVSEAEAAEAVGVSEQPAAVAKAKPDILKPAARIELPEESKETHVAKGEAPVEPKGKAPSEKVKAPAANIPEISEVVGPVGPMNVPTPAVMRGPRVVRMERPEVISRPRPARVVEPRVPETEGPIRGVAAKIGKKGREGVKEDETAKAKRAKGRTNPRRGRTGDPVEQLKEWRDRDLLERSQRLAQASDHPTVVSRAKPKKSKSSAKAAVQAGKIQVSEPITLKEFCSAIGVPFSRLFPKLMAMGIPATINQNIATDQAELLALEFGIELDVQRQKSRYEELVEQFQNRKGNTVRRSPIVTFLGHVDHGKTSLLDRIRHARVASGEAGGITQHIGAYRCPIEDRHVVFLDTPGHEAFTALRARGAQMTDIVVLVVAADDGVMPQTKEAISHAKAAGVPIVVALNKIDLPNADENKVFGQLSENGLIPAEWGGEVDIIRTSAATGEGIDALVEHLSTLSELLDIKGDPTGAATGVVIEAHQDPNRGAIADIMVQEGTLKISDVLVIGSAYGRVRAMFDDTGKSIQEAGPATPVEILGLDTIPDAGDHFYVTEDQKLAQAIAEEKRQENRSEYLLSRPKVTLENIFQQVEAGQVQHLNLIVKTDTQGSMDVLRSKLSEMGTDEVKVRILHTAVGGITEGDAILADASNAIILGFGVVADDIARNKAKELDVEIRTYTVIYHLLEDITSAMEGLLEPTYEQKVMGRAVVREVFKVTRVGTVAGCMVTDGLVERSAKVRIIRQNVIVRENMQLDSLKRFKDDAREVRQGLECGIKLAGFDDIKEGDIIEAYQVIEVARKLQPAGSV
jgi:translation initiation factor IF-2